MDPHVPAAVRDRDRGHRGGRPHPAHHEHRQLRPRRRARRDEGAGAVRARRRRLDPPVRAHRRPREGPVPRHRPQEPRGPADAEGGRQVRGPRRRHRHRHVAGRSPADGRPHHADGRGRQAGDRGRRPPAGGHRRHVHVSRPGHRRRHVGGRRQRARGDPAVAAVVDQQRHRAARPGRCGDRGDARGRGRPVQPRAVLPHGVGVELRGPAARGAQRPRLEQHAGAAGVAAHRW